MKYFFPLILFGLILVSGCVLEPEPQVDKPVLQEFSDFFKNTSISVSLPTTSSSQAIADFKQKYCLSGEAGEIDYCVQVNTDTGIPDRITGFKTEPYVGKPWEVAIKFLQENQNLFQIQPNSLFFSSYFDDGSWYTIGFDERYRDIPVYNAKIVVRVAKDNSIDLVEANYFPDINISDDFKLSILEVKGIAKKYYEKTLQTQYQKNVLGEINIEDSDIQKTVLPHKVPADKNYDYHLAWFVDVPDYRLTINDKTKTVSELYTGPVTS